MTFRDRFELSQLLQWTRKAETSINHSKHEDGRNYHPDNGVHTLDCHPVSLLSQVFIF